MADLEKKRFIGGQNPELFRVIYGEELVESVVIGTDFDFTVRGELSGVLASASVGVCA